MKWWNHLLECSLLNTYVLDGLAFPDLHARRGHNKSDHLSFHLEVAAGLIGLFSSRQRAAGGPKCSNEDRN